MKMLLSILVCVSMLAFSGTAFALSVNGSVDGVSLVNTILDPNPDLTVVDGSILYTGVASASGTFSDGVSSGIGIESGIIMTTGNAAHAPGPNNADDTWTYNDVSGDSDLAALIGVSALRTYDATVLEFDFDVNTEGTLSFNYVFASEEYNEWVNSQYNDVFAFFLDGTNIALIPGTDIPVAINTVNNGPGDNPHGHSTHSSNSEYFNNNDLDDGGPYYNIEYDGFTDVFAATAFIGEGTHHIKLAITDVSDPFWDSGVFIEAGSFSFEEGTPVPEPGTMLLLGTGLAGLIGFGRKKLL